MIEHLPLSDVEIARRIEADDRDALRSLIRRNNPMMYRAARSILRDDAEAEDAVQEAFILAYQRIDAYRGDAKLSTWLVRIVVNEAIGRLRRRARRAEIIASDADAGDWTQDGVADDSARQPEAQAMRAEAMRLLERSIDALPGSFRAVFVLREVQQMSVEETAAALGIPAATVRTRYFRARSRLRESLSRDFDSSCQDAFSFAGARCARILTRVLRRLADRTNVRCPLHSVC